VQRFVVGLSKKVLLANNLGKLWDVYLSASGGEVTTYGKFLDVTLTAPGVSLTTLGAWLGILAFSLQLYFDFSGYSDMAIGLGRMLGFEFLENFNYPYISKSATEFWRRWHISLGTWFREYLYIPLGGNRVSRGRLIFNLLIVWAATGIWHGASWNFLIWGLYYFFWLVAEKLFLGKWLQKIPGWLSHLYGLLVVVVGWTIFAVEDFSQLGQYLRAMFGVGAAALDGAALYYLRGFLPMLVVGAVAAAPLAKTLWDKLPDKARRAALPILMAAGLVLSTAYLVDGTYNPFLYFRF
jgi:alginate O-acetyltransferase complex protein AlgI